MYHWYSTYSPLHVLNLSLLSLSSQNHLLLTYTLLFYCFILYLTLWYCSADTDALTLRYCTILFCTIYTFVGVLDRYFHSAEACGPRTLYRLLCGLLLTGDLRRFLQGPGCVFPTVAAEVEVVEWVCSTSKSGKSYCANSGYCRATCLYVLISGCVGHSV